MNPQPQELKEIKKVNRAILGVFLLFLILGAGFYGSLKFIELQEALSAAPIVQNTVVVEMSDNQKANMLASVAMSDADIEEKEKLTMLRNLALQSSMDIKNRNAALDSLK